MTQAGKMGLSCPARDFSRWFLQEKSSTGHTIKPLFPKIFRSRLLAGGQPSSFLGFLTIMSKYIIGVRPRPDCPCFFLLLLLSFNVGQSSVST